MIVAMSLVTTYLVAWAYDIHNSERFVSRKHIYEIIVAESQNAIVITDDDGRIVVFNRAAEKLFDRDRSDVLGISIEQLIPEQFRRKHRERFKALVDGDRRGEYSPYRHPSPKMHPVECHIVRESGERVDVRLDIRDLGDQMLAIIEEIPDNPE